MTCTLAYDTVGCNAVDGMGSLSGVIRRELLVDDQLAVCIRSRIDTAHYGVDEHSTRIDGYRFCRCLYSGFCCNSKFTSRLGYRIIKIGWVSRMALCGMENLAQRFQKKL